MVNDLGEVIERIREFFWVRPVAVPKARVIRRDEVITIGKPGEQRLEHPRRRWQSVQKENRRRILRASLSIKDREPIYLCRAIKSRVFHGTFLSLGLGEQLKRCEHHSGGAGNKPHVNHKYFSVEARSVPRIPGLSILNHQLSSGQSPATGLPSRSLGEGWSHVTRLFKNPIAIAVVTGDQYDREMLKAIPFLVALAAAVFAQDSAKDEAQIWNLEKAYWEYVKANDLE